MKRLRRERDMAPGQTIPAAMSGISDSSVSWPSLSRIACLKLGCSGDSPLARKRVPSSTPSAPSASAAARPRPSAMPPAARTGTGATASTTIGTSAMLACQPTWPPPSVPCAMMTSAPAVAARTASGTPPAMNVTLQPASWARAMKDFTSCSGRGQANAIAAGRKAERRGKAVLSMSKMQKIQREALVGPLADRGGAARICSGLM